MRLLFNLFYHKYCIFQDSVIIMIIHIDNNAQSQYN